jgi:hypothetical protein
MKTVSIRTVNVTIGLCIALASGPLVAGVLPQGLKIEKVLDSPVELGELAQSPKGELWLLERTSGVIRVFDAGIESATLTIDVGTAPCKSGLLDVAFSPDYMTSGDVFVYYVDSTGAARVSTVHRGGSGLSLGSSIIEIGTTATGCNPGGGLVIGTDGKLYVGTGDLGVSGNGQLDGTKAGKILRAELDGSVPADNPSGSLEWAKGIRNGRDFAVGSAGGIYVVDLGDASVHDELNELVQGGNYGWAAAHGSSGGAYDDPLESHLPSVGCESVVTLADTRLGDDHLDALVHNDTTNDLLEEILPGGSSDVLYDADGDATPPPDPNCPRHIDALEQGADGWLYASASGSNAGVWRVWRDEPGPREVSAPGSPFRLTVDRDGSSLVIGWENLGSLDAGPPPRSGGQHGNAYQVWEGTLPIGGPGNYDHTVLRQTNGAVDGAGRFTETVAPGSGSRYYLVSAQGDNMEGSLGRSSLAAPNDERPGRRDYCDDRGSGWTQGLCAADWVDPNDGVTEIGLVDYNPASPTHLQTLKLSDFRGNVVKLDMSALNCYWCGVQAPLHWRLESKYKDRDFRMITVMTSNYLTLSPINPSECASRISAWADQYKELHPILCDSDLNGNNVGDVSQQIAQSGCGTPQNLFIDQGNVFYDFLCGAFLSEGEVEPLFTNELNPESCE